MAVVLIVRPQGLLGRPQIAVRGVADPEDPIRPASACGNLRVDRPCRARRAAAAGAPSPYTLVLGIDVLIAILFATSLHFIMGPGGHAFVGHAADFGLGADGAALLVKWFAAPMTPALAARLLRPQSARSFSAGLRAAFRVDLADATSAFAQIVWSIVFQWQEITGGSTASSALAERAVRCARRDDLLALALAAAGVPLLRRCCRPVRLCHAGRPDSRCAPKPSASTSSACTGSLSPWRCVSRHCRRPVRLRQGLDLAGDDQYRALHRWAGDGAARRHPDADRPDRRRIRVRGASGHGDAADRYWRARLGGIILVLVLASPAGSRSLCANLQAPGAAMTELSVISLTKAFGALRAVDNVSFSVSRGEFLR